MSSNEEVQQDGVVDVIFNGPIGLNPRFVVKDVNNNIQQVIDALKIDQNGVYTIEQGSIQFVFGINVDSSRTIHLHEKFHSVNDLTIHNNCDHMNDIIKLINDPTIFDVVDLPGVFHHYSSPDQQQQEQQQEQNENSKIGSVPGRYCLNVTSYVKDEYRTEFINLMISHQQLSLSEPECIQFDWGVSATNPNVFYQHVSRTGLDYHTTTDHFAKFMEFNEQEPYTQPQDVYHFVLL